MGRVSVTMAAGTLPFRCEYFQSVSITFRITNNLKKNVLIVLFQLRFQSDSGCSPPWRRQECSIELRPEESKEYQVEVVPSPVYLQYTNFFDLILGFRILGAGVRGAKDETEAIEQLTYIVVSPSSANFGESFISFTQPEDQRLAEVLTTYNKRAGFQPYRAVTDPRPGTDFWERIYRLLKGAKVVFIIWTRHASFSHGVKKELDYCAQEGIPFVLLREKDAPLPSGYDDSLEYTDFDSKDPYEAFCEAVSARRRLLIDPAGGT